MTTWFDSRPPTVDEVPDYSEANVTLRNGAIDFYNGCDIRKYWRGNCGDDPIAWAMPPEPYTPPKPDTSLAASIERMSEWVYGKPVISSNSYGCSILYDKDQKRILEAARKWEAAMKKNNERPDLEGRLPIVYNGRSAEEWYTLYSQLLLKNTSDEISN